MFGSIGGAELVLVLVLALLLFGPRKLPQIGRKLGDALAEFRKATHDFKSTLESEVELEQVRAARRELSSAVDEARHIGRPRSSLVDASSPSAKPDVKPAEAAADPAGSSADGDRPPSVPVPDAGGRPKS